MDRPASPNAMNPKTSSDLIPPNDPPADQLSAMFDPDEFRNLRNQAGVLRRLQLGRVIGKTECKVLETAFETVTQLASMRGKAQIDGMRQVLQTMSEYTRTVEAQKRLTNASDIQQEVFNDFENRLVQIEKANLRPELKQLLTDRLSAELQRFISSTENL